MADIPIENLVIGGQRVPPSSGEYFDDINPATGEVIAQIARGNNEDIDAAVQSALAAQKIWINTPAEEREAIMKNMAGLLSVDGDSKHPKRIARLDSKDAGKLYKPAMRFDLPESSERFYYNSDLTRLIGVPTATGAIRGNAAYAVREPFGVVGVITPSNYPWLLLINWVAPALAAGNAVVAKPSPEAPRSALYLAELAKEAGFPPGLVNVVTGDADTGQALVDNRYVGLIAFTGGTKAGRAIMGRAAAYNKKVIPELGGKSAMIVCEDADPKYIVPTAFSGAFLNTGQLCTAETRLLIHKSIYNEVVEKLIGYTNERVHPRDPTKSPSIIGDPLGPNTEIGPMISERYLQKVLQYVEIGKQEGANLVAGGKRFQVDGLPNGYFMEPTIFTNVRDDSRLAQEEIFGPVLSVLAPFETLEEAVSRANNINYGLVAGILTQDPDKLLYAAQHLDVGNVWPNRLYNLFAAGVPFPARKASGFGVNLGRAGFDEMTQLKVFVIPTDLEDAVKKHPYMQRT